MKKILSFIIIMIFAVSAKAQIKAVSMDEAMKMADTSSIPVIVNFWATWCKPCVHELPYFEKHVNATNGKVRLILVSLDFKENFPKGLSAFAKQQGYRSTIVWLKDTNAEEYIPKVDSNWSGAIPATIMINKAKGYRQFFNHQLTEERFVLELNKLLN